MKHQSPNSEAPRGLLPLLLIAMAPLLIITIVIFAGREQRIVSDTAPRQYTEPEVISEKAEPASPETTLLERIRKRGELIVATRNGPTTYYIGTEGPLGFENDLATAFADYLGVKARFEIPDTLDDIFSMIEKGEADIAAAGITVLEKRKKRIRFGPSYQKVTQQLVYRSGNKKPKNISSLEKGRFKVIEDSSHEHELLKLRAAGELNIEWSNTSDADLEDLLYQIQEKTLDYTIADSNEVSFNIRYFPNIRIAFDLTGPQQLAWAMQKSGDDSLQKEVEAFFRRPETGVLLEELQNHYYGHIERLSGNDTHEFWKNVNKRLPKYEPLFRKIADEAGYEWELLAAIGYQESHWDPTAVSPTGVKGLMMLTKAAASHVNISDRENPEQSVVGAVRYLDMLGKQLPEDIVEPDRLWFTLAGYNVGLGHLEDARVLTQRLGGDPDNWYDVRKRLPLLGQKKWYTTVKHGYARGREPVKYVDNIRNYYELLVWYDSFRPIENQDSSIKSANQQDAIAAAPFPAKDKPRTR